MRNQLLPLFPGDSGLDEESLAMREYNLDGSKKGEDSSRSNEDETTASNMDFAMFDFGF